MSAHEAAPAAAQGVAARRPTPERLISLLGLTLALGYLAVRAVASGLSGAAESGRLDVLLSAPVSRRRLTAASFAATAIELAVVLVMTVLLTVLGSVISGADLSFGSALAGYANVWPLALIFAGLGVVATGWSEDPAIEPKVAECLHIAEVFEHAGDFDIIHNGFDFLPLTYAALVDTPVVTTIPPIHHCESSHRAK